MATDDGEPKYACKCLNIRLSEKQVPSDKDIQHAKPSSVDEYEPLYIGEGGVNVAHNELTLRIRSSVLDTSSSEAQRKQHISVTCMVCNIAAYRVLVIVPADVEAKVGPMLPTEDWVEQDVLLSGNGWIQVHVGKSGCISRQEIKQVMSSSIYSARYSVALVNVPQDHLTSTTPILPETKITVPSSHAFLPELPPFLPPPPFTPSHPIFLHLSSIATAASDAFRKTAKSSIEEFTRRELQKIEDQECQLKAQVEHLWRNIRECLNKAQREKDAALFASLKSKRRSMSPGSHTPIPNGLNSHVVRSFIPNSQHASRHVTSSSAPHHSALSSSLATSSFHHPAAQRTTANGRLANDTHAANALSAEATMPSAGSSGSPPEGLSIASRSLRRNMDMENDTIVTFKWSLIEEEERKAREKKKKANENKPADVKKSNENRRESTQEASASTALTEEVQPGSSAPSGESHSSLRNGQKKSPGKRKVTFKVEPKVVTIKGNDKPDDGTDSTQDNEDLIFDLDNSDMESSSPIAQRKNGVHTKSPKGQASKLVFTSESSERPRRSKRDANNIISAGLPGSFAALRPASLPAPSNVRPRLHASGSGASPSQPEKPRKGILSHKSEGSSSPMMAVPESHLPYQKELLKLLGADTPIHRGSWGPASESWRIFDSSRDKGKYRATEDDDLDQAEGNEPTWRRFQMPGVASSLPVPMAPISQQGANGAKSLGKKSVLEGRIGSDLASVEEEDEKRSSKSAVASRREAYAERDRARSLDPGILDFIPDGDDGDEGNQSDQSSEDLDQIPMSRNQRSALEIIKAADSLPSEGMWRSLAS